MRRYSVCHIRDEWDTAQAHWSVTWCGRRSFLEHDYVETDREKARIDKQLEKKKARPWKHCLKCVKARKLVEPEWTPKEPDDV